MSQNVEGWRKTPETLTVEWCAWGLGFAMAWDWRRIRPGSERCLGTGEGHALVRNDALGLGKDTPWFGTMPWGRGGYALVRNDASGLGGGRAHRWGPLLSDGAQSRPHPLVAAFFFLFRGRRGMLLVEPGCVFEGKGTNEVSPRNLAAGRSIPVFREAKREALKSELMNGKSY